MRIQMITPAPPGTLYGNRITALRYARILRRLGHRVRVAQRCDRRPCDLLVALHARRSAESVFEFHRRFPERPVVVVLTGTDIYGAQPGHRDTRRALELATRLVALQPLALRELPARLRRKARVIYQSVEKTKANRANPSVRDMFTVCVVGHLRKIKDPFRTALASRLLPRASRIRVLHVGTPMEEGMAARARREERVNPRYRWLGGLPYRRTRRLMASSRLLVLSSVLEGGPGVISEAVVDGVPVLASRIPGAVGLLGAGYPGYFPAGNTRALARLLARAETDKHFYARLRGWCRRRAPQFHPARERAAWKKLLRELRPSLAA